MKPHQAGDWNSAPEGESGEASGHSLFGEVLDWMLAPLLLLWPMSIAITYLVAKSIANQPFDHALEDNVAVLAQQVRQINSPLLRRLSASAREILRADDVDHVYFQILDQHGAYIDGDRDLPAPQEANNAHAGAVFFRNDTLHGTPIRVAYSYIERSNASASAQRLALVQVAETLDKRAQLANEIIKGVILPQFIILPIVLALVWFALARGLSPLAQLQQHIRARTADDLSPIEAGQVPEEIAPLVDSFNDMLARLACSMALQKRFIADAAHQMKTPLAGMRMQSELALRQTDQTEIQRSLLQLAKSSESATRLVNQLLALARAENQTQAGNALIALDVCQLARDTLRDWVMTSFARQIDLGFEAPDTPVLLEGQPVMLRELLSNLIDNALRYTAAAGQVTVRVRNDAGHAVLEVEDSGPGISPPDRLRIFERFYRVLGTNTEGSGLGLAIVQEIAQQHGATVEVLDRLRTSTSKPSGSLFRLRFPPLPSDPNTHA